MPTRALALTVLSLLLCALPSQAQLATATGTSGPGVSTRQSVSSVSLVIPDRSSRIVAIEAAIQAFEPVLTGEIVAIAARPVDAFGRTLPARVSYEVTGAGSATAVVSSEGEFMASRHGHYTVRITAGPASTSLTITVHADPELRLSVD